MAAAYLVLSLSALVFAAALQFSGVVGDARAAVLTSQRSFAVMRAADLSDDEKEAAVQQASLRLLRMTGALILKLALALAASLLVVGASVLTGIVSLQQATAGAGNIWFLTIAGIVVLAIMVLRR